MRGAFMRGARMGSAGMRRSGMGAIFVRRFLGGRGGTALRGDGRHSECARRESREKEAIHFSLEEQWTHS